MECHCSKERMENGLLAIGKEELQNILQEDKKAELVCNFCGKKYYFEEEELKRLLEKGRKK